MKYIKIFIVLFVLSAMGSCEENDNFYKGPSIAHFAKEKYKFNVSSSEDTFKLPLYLTKVSPSPRTFTVELIDEKTDLVLGDDFNFNPEVTVPAGELYGSLKVSSEYDILEPFEKSEIAFRIVRSEGENDLRSEVSLEVSKFCEYSLNFLEGVYGFQFSEASQPYEVNLIKGINQLVAKNLYAEGFDIRLYITKVDDVTYNVNIPKQTAYVYNQKEVFVSGSGLLNTCGELEFTQIFTDSNNNEIERTLSVLTKI
ncbi:hypothetical protein [Marinigracilibium pacificum]|uniref:DUF4843 domain-containing protein n=1 Tax=Marinigracilibium pacificum TaxID=2729599 RepID=A0A848J8I6_9BACT|nr:hypothetical protein [Marinigracilibium pacificum]NMM50689.1 hypothetical protein [Marinigracilibium pacificum]